LQNVVQNEKECTCLLFYIVPVSFSYVKKPILRTEHPFVLPDNNCQVFAALPVLLKRIGKRRPEAFSPTLRCISRPRGSIAACACALVYCLCQHAV